MTDPNHRPVGRHSRSGRFMLVAVLAAIVVAIGVAVYGYVDRPGQGTLTPAGAEYVPGVPAR